MTASSLYKTLLHVLYTIITVLLTLSTMNNK